MATLLSFEELEAWKIARELSNAITHLTKSFPIEEKYRLKDQMIRAVRSVTANIAEGFGRFHYQENLQFCRQARGSLSETLNHLICALDEGYISPSVFAQQRDSILHCWKVLNGYIAYLSQAAQQKNRLTE